MCIHLSVFLWGQSLPFWQYCGSAIEKLAWDFCYLYFFGATVQCKVQYYLWFKGFFMLLAMSNQTAIVCTEFCVFEFPSYRKERKPFNTLQGIFQFNLVYSWVVQLHECRNNKYNWTEVANIQSKRPFWNCDIIHLHILYEWRPAGQTPCLPVGWFAAVKDDRLHLPLPVATPHRLPAKQRVPVCAKRTEARLGWHAPLPETQEPFSSLVCIGLLRFAAPMLSAIILKPSYIED